MTTKFDASVAMTSSMNKACASMTGDFSMEVVRTLAEMYKFDADEAIRTLGLSCITIKKTQKKSASASASASAAKPAIKKAPKAKWETPTCILPWCGTAFPNQDFCQGLRLNHGLHSQCTMKSVNGGNYCTTCQKQADKNENGKPTYGDVEMRSQVGLLDYREPKSNKQTIPYANIMQKLKIPIEVAMFQATAFGLEIPEEHMVFRKTMRGRPKAARTSIVSDDEDKPKAKRGRPKKPKKVIESATGDDLIASLVAQASISSHEPEPIQVEAKPETQVEAKPEIQVEAKPEETTSSASESEGEGAKKKKGRSKKVLTPEEIEAKKKKRNEAAKKRRADKKAAAEQAAIESDEEAEFQEVCKIVQDELKAMDLACDPREVVEVAPIQVEAAAPIQAKVDEAAPIQAKVDEAAPIQVDEVKPDAKPDNELEKEPVFDVETDMEEDEEEEEEEALQVKAVTINGTDYLQEIGGKKIFDPESQDWVGDLEDDGSITLV